MQVLGTPIDITKITQDLYLMGGMTDHITPWQGTYSTTRLVSGDRRYVLTSTGHVQSLVAATGHRGLSYFTNPTLPDKAQEWFEGASQHQGTWWADWVEWLRPRSGEMKDPPTTAGNTNYPPMEEAPGLYIFT